MLLATTSHGALKVSASSGDFHVKYTGVGATQIGAPNVDKPSPQTLAALSQIAPQLASAIATLDNALPPVQYQNNILRALWTKLSVNAVINPLTALHNIKISTLLSLNLNKAVFQFAMSLLRYRMLTG